MAGNKSSEGKYITSKEAFFIRDKIIERNLKHCKSLTPLQVDTIVALAKEYEDDDNPLSLKVNVDVSDALKGLKAVQREAKKATAALKELKVIRTDDDMAKLISNLYPITFEDAKIIIDGIMEGHTNSLLSVKRSKISGIKPHSVVFDEMHTACIKCGSTNREVVKVMSAPKECYAREIKCSDCGYVI